MVCLGLPHAFQVMSRVWHFLPQVVHEATFPAPFLDLGSEFEYACYSIAFSFKIVCYTAGGPSVEIFVRLGPTKLLTFDEESTSQIFRFFVPQQFRHWQIIVPI